MTPSSLLLLLGIPLLALLLAQVGVYTILYDVIIDFIFVLGGVSCLMMITIKKEDGPEGFDPVQGVVFMP